MNILSEISRRLEDEAYDRAIEKYSMIRRGIYSQVSTILCTKGDVPSSDIGNLTTTLINDDEIPFITGHIDVEKAPMLFKFLYQQELDTVLTNILNTSRKAQEDTT